MNGPATTELLAALHYAAELHTHGKRKGKAGEPYVNHVIEVAELLARVGGVTDTATLQAALLHDAVEDTEATLADLEARFSRAVRDMVAEVTDDKTLPKEKRKRLQIEHAPSLSPGAKMIKVADKTSNVRAIGASPPADWPQERRLDYLDWAEAVVDGCRGCNSALEDFFDETLDRARALIRRSPL
jgi:guanosine-3',5'-bis(diphosphate) 3'-pyrophosphohydrolase